jgi:hypothetical protein
VAWLHGAMAVFGAKMFWHVLENVVHRTAICLEMDEGRFEHPFDCEVPVV